ncbi:hypothetical protein PQR12_36345 [Paraburkholderia nemoris]|uniref:hypothetical protein n=1 Tax=Paraburkholderia nemoris TaxID=2793076 RepID=UPI0038BA1156
MPDNQIWGRPAKHYVVALAVVLWLFILIYAVIKNPSTTDASVRMSMMKADMATMLGNGGAVVYRNENAKFGGALLSLLIRTDSWSQQLRDRDIKTLVDLGWQQMPTSPASFCKKGVLAEIQENVGDYKNTSTVLISMRYNATTSKICK